MNLLWTNCSTVLRISLVCIFCCPLWAQSVKLTTRDGLLLELSQRGRVRNLSIRGQAVQLTEPGGFFIADYKNQPEPKNLVPNAGFEEGSVGWNLTKTQTIDHDIFHTGKASVRIHVPSQKKASSNVGRRVPVEPNKRYRVSLWVRRQNCGVCGAYISQLDEHGKFATKPLQVGMRIPRVDGKWLHVTRDIETTPRTRQLLVRADIYRSTGTIWLDDFSVSLMGPKLYLPVVGTIRKLSDGSIIFDGKLPEAKLEISARYVPEPGKIKIEGNVHDLSGKDRAVSIAFRLPFDAGGWTWFDDTVDHRVISEPVAYWNTYHCESGDGFCSVYPLSALSGKSIGLSLALPLAQGPRVFLLGYDNEQKFAFVNFYFGLSRVVKKWPSRAGFSFVLYQHDPKWGMRSALQRYYEFYPESFKKRPPFEGFLNYANLERFDPKTHRLIVRGPGQGGWEDASDFGEGYRFLWHLHGCYDFRMVHTEQRERLSDKVVFQLLREMVEKEHAKPRSYCPTEHTLKKLVYDHLGHIRYIGDTRYWEPHQGYNHTDKPGWGLNFRVNEDPEISDVLAKKTRSVLEKYAQEGEHPPFDACLTADAIEGYFGNTRGLDYRPDHIAVTDLPLTFGERTLQPAIPNTIWDFHKTIWWPLTEKYKVATYGNANAYEQVFILPFVDVPMIEWDWDRSRPGRLERYCRIVAHHKIWRFWRTLGKGEGDPESVRYHFRRGLAYAIYPAVYPMKTPDTYRAYYRQYVPAINALSIAGWEPVPYAYTNDADVVVERYGSIAADNLHLTLRNYAAESRTVIVTLDGKGLGVHAKEANLLLARNLLSGRVVRLSGEPITFKTTVNGNGSAAFWVGTSENAERHAIHQADEGLQRVERFFSTELSEESRRLLTEGHQIAIKGAAGGKLLATARKLHDLLDRLQSAIKTHSTVDKVKIIYRIKSELSAGVAIGLHLDIHLPRLVKAPQGGRTTVEGTLINRGKADLINVRTELLSPWSEVASKCSVSGVGGRIRPEKEVAAHLRLVIPAKPQRRLLPFLLALEGKVDGDMWHVDVPIDVEVAPPLSVGLAASKLFPGINRRVYLLLSNTSADIANGKVKFGAVKGISIQPSEFSFSVPPGGKIELPFHVSVARDAKLGIIQIPVSTISSDNRFVISNRLSVRLTHPVPRADVHRVSVAPTIDGDLAEAVWRNAPMVDELVAIKSGESVTEKTSVWMAYDDSGLYIAFRCEESNMAGIVALYTKRGSPLYEDDDVEVFILPPGQLAATQLAVNSLGTQSDNVGNLGSWRAAARRFGDHWTVEIAVPYSVFKLDRPPKPDEVWEIQFGRQQKQKKETSAWTRCPYFRALDRFGEVVFK